MNLENILADAQKAVELVSAGREALAAITAAVHDSKAALGADTQAALDRMLTDEEAQTRAALADLRSAIAQYRAG